jgi:hypothetical protein
MIALIVFIAIGLLAWLLSKSCTFKNHRFETVRRDEEYHCHDLKCAKCGRETKHDPYAGIGG